MATNALKMKGYRQKDKQLKHNTRKVTTTGDLIKDCMI